MNPTRNNSTATVIAPEAHTHKKRTQSDGFFRRTKAIIFVTISAFDPVIACVTIVPPAVKQQLFVLWFAFFASALFVLFYYLKKCSLVAAAVF